jgi:hypothetical protein
VTAVSGDLADSATITLPVYTPVTAEAFATYGVIDSGAVLQPLLAPEGVIGQFGGLEISTSSTALQALTDAVIDPNDADRFYVGMEKQPFITEVFMGLVYPKSNFNDSEWTSAGGTAPPAGQEELPPDVNDGGENFVDDTSKPSLVVAIQVANPYDTPVSLGDYRLQLFGQNFSFAAGAVAAGYPLNELVLPPATLGRPSTAIVYAVVGTQFGGYPATGATFKQGVLDFFDLERGAKETQERLAKLLRAPSTAITSAGSFASSFVGRVPTATT